MGIVVSNAYALSAVAAAEGWKPTIGWDSRVTVATISADEEDPFYPATNLANPSTALRWQGTDTSVQHLTTLFDAKMTDYLGIARHNFGSGQITVSVEGLEPGGDPDDDGDWSEIVGEKLPADDGPLVFRPEQTLLIGTRVKLQPSSTIPRAAVMKCGKLIVLQYGLPPGHVPIKYGRNVSATSTHSQGGDFLGRIVSTESLVSSIEQHNLDPDWYRETLEPFRAASDVDTFFWVPFPRDYPDEAGYCEVTNSPMPTISQTTGLIDITFQIAGTM